MRIPSNKFPGVLAGSFFIAALLIGGVFAVRAEEGDTLEQRITFPIPELGNCADKAGCRTFCDKPENMDACTTFAERQGLIPAAQAIRARAFGQAMRQGGPGGCRTPEQCVAYCDSEEHATECLAFAERHGLMARSEADRIRRFHNTLKDEDTQRPGDCTDRASCEQYCSEPEHVEECIAFAQRTRIFPEAELERAKQFIEMHRDRFRMQGSPLSSPPGGAVRPSCVPRPACLDTTPRCLLPEPAQGWCSPDATNRLRRIEFERSRASDLEETPEFVKPSLPPDFQRGAPTNFPPPPPPQSFRDSYLGSIIRFLLGH